MSASITWQTATDSFDRADVRLSTRVNQGCAVAIPPSLASWKGWKDAERTDDTRYSVPVLKPGTKETLTRSHWRTTARKTGPPKCP
jgi:hypothetical protein